MGGEGVIVDAQRKEMGKTDARIEKGVVLKIGGRGEGNIAVVGP